MFEEPTNMHLILPARLSWHVNVLQKHTHNQTTKKIVIAKSDISTMNDDACMWIV